MRTRPRWVHLADRRGIDVEIAVPQEVEAAATAIVCGGQVQRRTECLAVADDARRLQPFGEKRVAPDAQLLDRRAAAPAYQATASWSEAPPLPQSRAAARLAHIIAREI